MIGDGRFIALENGGGWGFEPRPRRFVPSKPDYPRLVEMPAVFASLAVRAFVKLATRLLCIDVRFEHGLVFAPFERLLNSGWFVVVVHD